jgi:hypothetical protein
VGQAIDVKGSHYGGFPALDIIILVSMASRGGISKPGQCLRPDDFDCWLGTPDVN